MPSKPKPKAKGVSSAGKPRKAATKSKLPTKAGTIAKAGVSAKAGASAKSTAPGDWRAQMLAHLRALIFEADPEMIEEQKWIKPTRPLGVPLWSHHGMVCTGEIYKQVVKLTFAYGASLPDPSRLFNSSLDGNTRRAIDIAEGETVDAGAFKALVKAAVARNVAAKKP